MPSRVRLCVTPWTVARHAPLSMGFPRQKSWSEVPFPPPGRCFHSGWLNKPTWFQWTAVKREHHGEAGEEIWVLRWWEVLGRSDGKVEDRSDRGTQGNDREGLKRRCLESHWLAYQDEVKWKPNLGREVWTQPRTSWMEAKNFASQSFCSSSPSLATTQASCSLVTPHPHGTYRMMGLYRLSVGVGGCLTPVLSPCYARYGSKARLPCLKIKVLGLHSGLLKSCVAAYYPFFLGLSCSTCLVLFTENMWDNQRLLPHWEILFLWVWKSYWISEVRKREMVFRLYLQPNERLWPVDCMAWVCFFFFPYYWNLLST